MSEAKKRSDGEKGKRGMEAGGPIPSGKVRGEHTVHVFVSHELKQRLQRLAVQYDRTVSDMVRAVLKIGIPMMEGLSEAEEVMVKEYIELFRDLRKVKSLREI